MALDDIPPLAGIDRAAAARVGPSVEQSVDRLLRLHWAERRLMQVMIGWIPAAPIWEVKCALSLHQWYAMQHADAIATRITEMRSPAPRLDRSPDESLELLFDEVLRSANVAELVSGLYESVLPAIRAACSRYLDETNELVDHPSRRIIRQCIADHEEAIAWGERALAAIRDSHPIDSSTDSWRAHLQSLVSASGGIAGDLPAGTRPAQLRSASGGTPPSLEPRRDERFAGSWNFEFPPHVVYNLPDVPADERNLALLCKRALEMDVPEMMATFITERPNEPWAFYRDYSRQLWDEARHAMMGTVGLEEHGVDWKHDVPLNVSFALRLGQHATPIERQMMLYAIEQSLMPSETGKRFEYETAVESGDALSAHFHDFDWADEVLHAQIGREALKREGISRAEAERVALEVHQHTWNALERYRARAEQSAEWWRTLVGRVLGRPPVVDPNTLGAPQVITE